jgi:hypothetical protein
MAERKAMINRDHKLSITRQASPLNISRRTGLLLARPVSPAGQPGRSGAHPQARRMHLEYPFMSARMLRDQLACGSGATEIVMRGIGFFHILDSLPSRGVDHVILETAARLQFGRSS